jgi:protein-L-isoaspartate(D-aspartate) O-methyltransferase
MGGAVEDIPMTVIRQLKEGGRLVCVKTVNGVGRGHIVTMRDGIPAGRDLFDANVAKLPGFEEPKGFEF